MWVTVEKSKLNAIKPSKVWNKKKISEIAHLISLFSLKRE